eukprot:gene13532-15997_t
MGGYRVQTGGSYNVTVKMNAKSSSAPGNAELSASLYQLTASGIPYTFQHSPTINSVSPAQGSSQGGMLMTITGTGFSSDESMFGTNTVIIGERVCDVVRNHDTELVCRTRASFSSQSVQNQSNFTGDYEFTFEGSSLEAWTRVAPVDGGSSDTGALNTVDTGAAHPVELLQSPQFRLRKDAVASIQWRLASVNASTAKGAGSQTQQLQLYTPAMAHENDHDWSTYGGQGYAFKPNVYTSDVSTTWPGTCSSTSTSEVYGEVWWRARMVSPGSQQLAVVSRVDIWGRDDCDECRAALEEIRVYIGDSTEHTTNQLACGAPANVTGAAPMTFTCDSARGSGVNVGRYLHLVARAPVQLSFCGIKVYGHLLDMVPAGGIEAVGNTSAWVLAEHAAAAGNASGSGAGFVGFALRRVSDDTYLAAAWAGAGAMDPEEVWAATQADDAGTAYTLDFLDYFDGTASLTPGAVSVGSVSISGIFTNATTAGMAA